MKLPKDDSGKWLALHAAQTPVPAKDATLTRLASDMPQLTTFRKVFVSPHFVVLCVIRKRRVPEWTAFGNSWCSPLFARQ